MLGDMKDILARIPDHMGFFFGGGGGERKKGEISVCGVLVVISFFSDIKKHTHTIEF